MEQKEEKMNCAICKKGETYSGKATVTLERNGVTLIFKGVPANICSICKEEYVDEEISRRLLKTAEEAIQTGVLLDVREYLAA